MCRCISLPRFNTTTDVTQGPVGYTPNKVNLITTFQKYMMQHQHNFSELHKTPFMSCIRNQIRSNELSLSSLQQQIHFLIFQSPIFSPFKCTESPLVPFIINLPVCKLWVRLAVLVFLPAKTQSFPSAKSP